MAPNKLSRDFSPSGKVAYATTNYVAFLDKESVHADFHFLMDFLRISPISYALTESPPIYAEIVDEMWRTADCNSPGGGISFTIKGNPYILTPSVINEALHFPNSDLENTPTSAAIISMLKAINYAASPWFLGRINTKHFRKEWSYFFETLCKVFAGKFSSFDSINMFVLRIAYSLLYGKRIDIGSLLLDEFAYKLGQVQNRDPVIYYARFLMIIANYFCKDLVIDDRNDTLPVPVQPKKLFATLVAKNLNAEVQFVLPEHIRVQLSNLYSSPSPTSSLLLSPTTEDVREGYTSPTLLALPSPHQSGTEAAASVSQSDKRINSTSASMTKDGNDETETAPEFVLPEQVQVQVSSLYSSPSPTSSLLLPPTMEDVIEGFSSPPQEALMSPHQSGIVATTSVTHSGKRKKTASPSITKDGNDETETATHPPQKKNGASNIRPSSSHFVVDQEMPPADIRDAIPVVEIPSSPEEERAKNDLLLLEPAREQEDRQVLMNAASILKSQLVTTLTRQAERISTQEMMTLADKCYNALEGLGDDFLSFRCSISKLIAQNQKLQSAAKKIEDWNECDIVARCIHQEQSLIEEEQGLSSAQGKLSTTETHADSLKIKREELKGMIRNLTEELNEVEETVKTLRAETDQREEARSIAKAELRKLEAEKQEAYSAIKDQYNAEKKVLERMSDHLLQQVRK